MNEHPTPVLVSLLSLEADYETPASLGAKKTLTPDQTRALLDQIIDDALALANEAADLLHALNTQEDLDQLTADAADRATRGGYIPPPGYGLPTAMPWPNKASDADPDREDPQ